MFYLSTREKSKKTTAVFAYCNIFIVLTTEFFALLAKMLLSCLVVHCLLYPFYALYLNLLCTTDEEAFVLIHWSSGTEENERCRLGLFQSFCRGYHRVLSSSGKDSLFFICTSFSLIVFSLTLRVSSLHSW